MRQFASQLGLLAVAGGALLAEGAPEYRQGEAAAAPPGELDDQSQHDVIDGEAEHLARLAGQDGVEEDAAQGDTLAAFVAEGVIDGEPDDALGDELGDEQGEQELTEFVPVPVGAGEQVVDDAIVADTLEEAERPDLGEGARPQADEPCLDDGRKVDEGLLAEAGAEVA